MPTESTGTPPKANPDEKTATIIDNFHHRMMALSALAASQLKHAQDNQDRDVQEQIEKMQAALGRLKSPENALDVARGQNASLSPREG